MSIRKFKIDYFLCKNKKKKCQFQSIDLIFANWQHWLPQMPATKRNATTATAHNNTNQTSHSYTRHKTSKYEWTGKKEIKLPQLAKEKMKTKQRTHLTSSLRFVCYANDKPKKDGRKKGAPLFTNIHTHMPHQKQTQKEEKGAKINWEKGRAQITTSTAVALNDDDKNGEQQNDRQKFATKKTKVNFSIFPIIKALLHALKTGQRKYSQRRRSGRRRITKSPHSLTHSPFLFKFAWEFLILFGT